MLGQGYNAGQNLLNTQRGLSTEADLPFAQDSLDRLNARVIYASPFSIPWSWTRGALGLQKGSAGGSNQTRYWKFSDALLNTSNKPSEQFAGQMPIFIAVSQLPINTQSRQDLRLPLSMVAPQLAWKPS